MPPRPAEAPEEGPRSGPEHVGISDKIYIFIPVVVVIAIIVIPIAVVFTRTDPDTTPVVNTTVGLIRGLNSEDGTHSMFLGIPYAVVNRTNPFGAATPNPRFEETFNAFQDKVRCPQRGDPNSTLDCLQLSIFVPKTEQKPLPVLVYIHGGRFSMGTSRKGDFGPRFLIRHNVIYVSVHYRVSAYGFMSLHTPEVPGNQGLKDQRNALRWIKNNIRAFGGDDENITIFGDSAGGVSTDLQLYFADDGLFHKVIFQSGAALAPWGIQEPDVDAPIKIANRIGLATNDTNEALTFISNANPAQVLEIASQLSIEFMPCVEREFPNVDSFMTNHTVNTPLPQARRIPILAGYNDDERLFTYANMPAEAFDRLDIFNHNVRLGFKFDENHETMMNYVRRFYAGDEPMSVNLRRNVMDFDSDFTFVHPTQRALTKYLENEGTAYHYVFTYVGGRNMLRNRLNITMGGACHADELGYLFDLPGLTETPSEDDQLIIDRITTMWTNFAKYGNPTPNITTLLPIQWLPVTRDRLNYLNLTKEISISTRPFHQRLSFWDFFYDTNREYVRGFVNASIYN